MRKFCLACFGLLIIPLISFSYVRLGDPAGFVNDYAGLMSQTDKNVLEKKLSDYRASTTNEISVVTIKSLNGDTIENYTNQLFNDWKIGKAGKDNGILVLAALEEKKMRIEVGYGLEGVLTDAQSYWIIEEVMKPAFRNNDYYGGLNLATDKIILAIGGEKIPEKQSSGIPAWFDREIFDIAVLVFIVLGSGLSWLTSILARSKSWWAGGIIGAVLGIIATIFFGLIFTGLICLVIFIPLGFLLDYLVSRGYRQGVERGRIPWWAGGNIGGFGGSSGGSGFGGFSGGSSGGGGSSGSW